MIYISAYYDFSKCGSYVTLILPSPLIEMIQTSLRLLHDLAIEKILTEHLEMFFNRTEAVKNIYVNKNWQTSDNFDEKSIKTATKSYLYPKIRTVLVRKLFEHRAVI